MGSITAYRIAIGRDLKRLRRRRDLTLRELSDQATEHGCDIAIGSLSRVERGERDLRGPEVLALALALDVAPVELLTPSGRDNDEQSVSVAGETVRWDVARRWAAGECALSAGIAGAIDAVSRGLIVDVVPHRRAEHVLSPMSEIAWQTRRSTPHDGQHRICVEMTADEIWTSVDGGDAATARMSAIREAEYQRRVAAEIDAMAVS